VFPARGCQVEVEKNWEKIASAEFVILTALSEGSEGL